MRASTIVVLTCLCVFAGSVSANSQGGSRQTIQASEQSSSSSSSSSQQSSDSENSSSRTETDGSSGRTVKSSEQSRSSNQAASQQSSSSSSENRKVVETAWNKLSKEERAAFQKWLTIQHNTIDKKANVDEFDDDDDIKGALIRYRKRFPVAIKKGDKGIELNFNLKTLMYSDLKSGDNQCICSCKNSKKPYFINVDQQKAED